MRLTSICVSTLSTFVALACQATVHVGEITDTSMNDSEDSSGSNGDTQVTDADTMPGTSDPNTSGPGTSGPGTTGPGTTDPNTTDPNTTDPNTTDPSGTTGNVGTTSDSDSTTRGASDTTTDMTTDGTTDGGMSTGGDEAMLDGWTKYRQVLIDNGLANDLSDFQIFVEITYDADMLPDYADLRFTDASGNKLLPYWIEWDLGPLKAGVWVRVPVVAGDDFTTIRMYYGNPDAPPATNGFDTFLFFDDFEAPALDGAKWKATAPVEIASGRLKITKGAVYTNKTAAAFPNTTIESRMQVYSANNISASKIFLGQGQTEVQGLKSMYFFAGASVFDGQKYVFFQNEQQGAPDAMNIWGITADDTDVYPRYNRYYSPPMAFKAAFQYYLSLGHPYAKLAELNDTYDTDIDWILIRRHAKPDPVTVVGGEKQP